MFTYEDMIHQQTIHTTSTGKRHVTPNSLRHWCSDKQAKTNIYSADDHEWTRVEVISVDTVGQHQLRGAYYTVTSVFKTNSLRRRLCCKPNVHCNKSRDPADIENLRLRRKLPRRYRFWQINRIDFGLKSLFAWDESQRLLTLITSISHRYRIPKPKFGYRSITGSERRRDAK